MEIPQNIQHQLAQFQQMQQQAQAITMQKQSVDLQIRETEKALEELEKVEDDAEVYKTAGNLLIKMAKPELTEECLRNGHGMCFEVCPRVSSGKYQIKITFPASNHREISFLPDEGKRLH